MEKNKFLVLFTTGKTKLQSLVDNFYQALGFKKWEFIFLIIIGCFSFLLWEHLQLKKDFAETQEIAKTLQKKTGLKLYSRDELKIRQIGELYVQIPEDWTNVVMDQITVGGVRKHFIASFGDGFDMPYSNEYAFAVGIERRGVKTDLETFLNNNAVSSDLEQMGTNYAKVNDEMFYIQRDDIGREYFRKVDDVILVIFVYNNGDREIDDFEQRFINSVGPVETNTLFDYK
ncbi:MAG: hypothetical protein IT416_00095 [Candidatus Pacebacteria bacterium]|nr:hypothetical protein [Candidatus Paceibacterota bacterium]